MVGCDSAGCKQHSLRAFLHKLEKFSFQMTRKQHPMLSSLVQFSCWRTELPQAASHLETWMKHKQGKDDLKLKLFPMQVSGKSSLGGWGYTEVEKKITIFQLKCFFSTIHTYLYNPKSNSHSITDFHLIFSAVWESHFSFLMKHWSSK